MTDRGTTVEELKSKVAKFVSAREWDRYHSPKNLAMSISIEAAEVMEHFQWLTVEEARATMQDPKVKEEVGDEIADVLIYCLSFANQTGIDISEVIEKKLTRNESRFPVDRISGFTVDNDSKDESGE